VYHQHETFSEDTMATARDVHVAHLMAEVEQERRLRLKAEQRASGLKSANQRLQSAVLKLKAPLMDSASRAKRSRVTLSCFAP
jgi:hypothetical protein